MGTIPNKTSQLLQDIKIKKFYSEDKQTLNLSISITKLLRLVLEKLEPAHRRQRPIHAFSSHFK